MGNGCEDDNRRQTEGGDRFHRCTHNCTTPSCGSVQQAPEGPSPMSQRTDVVFTAQDTLCVCEEFHPQSARKN